MASPNRDALYDGFGLDTAGHVPGQLQGGYVADIVRIS